MLSDPWFSGYAFEGGWGLKFENPEALERVAECDYLWISHPHPDHLHPPTLKRILEINPGIQVLGNHSLNFQLDTILSRMGFRNVTRLDERRPLALTPDLTVMRIPATGIRGYTSRRISTASGAWSSIRLIARASARISPASNRSTSVMSHGSTLVAAGHRLDRISRAMMTRWISLVPSPIVHSFASR